MDAPGLLHSFSTGSGVTYQAVARFCEGDYAAQGQALAQLIKDSNLSGAGYARKIFKDAELKELRQAVARDATAAAFLDTADSGKLPVTVLLLQRTATNAKQEREYLQVRTTALFDLFNEGALRGNDAVARQALLDSFGTLPNRFLTAAGELFVHPSDDPTLLRQIPTYLEYRGGTPGGIDKFPSLLSVRADRLRADGNRIVPSAMIRDGVHVGKRNIFMFHAAVNIAAYIGDDNLIDSHASVASSAQIGNRNKIGSFVSFEGVLSPANAVPVVVGDDNFIGTFARIGTGIIVGDKNFIAAGVNMSLGTKLRDCREASATKGQYVNLKELNGKFNQLAIVPNNAVREFNGVSLVPGEFVLFDNTEDFMSRFEGDSRIKANK